MQQALRDRYGYSPLAGTAKAILKGATAQRETPCGNWEKKILDLSIAISAMLRTEPP